MRRTERTIITTLTGLSMLAIGPGIASAATQGWDFCGSTGATWSTSTAGRSGTVTVTGDCATVNANWRMDVYVNGEWWVYSQGTVKSGTHTIRTKAPSMPKPNDKRGNYTYAKITYTYGNWKNVYEEDLGYLPCTGCTG
ncbi:hypothetical protein FB561_7490 [Kribbella amoyensis]|uniref:Secreted protein n=1 Tax=Kribbella amoyensis TaxID=996641 RepID=A0A561B0W5_9ACTN|nr:hypothetical protein [Kribbella amoyensis]TWD72498.1 hypothetical protein FB561_7490 [Kribbella amoyensis]